jgi:hypothetical protein
MFAHYYNPNACNNWTVCGKQINGAYVPVDAPTCPHCVKLVRAMCRLVIALKNMGIKV